MEKIVMENKSKYTMYSYLLIVLSIFILFVFTKDFLYDAKSNSDEVSIKNDDLAKKDLEFQEIDKVKKDIESGKIDKKELDKYLIKFNENELIDYFYSYANSNTAKIKIVSLNIAKGNLNEFGFKEGKIDLQVMFADEKSMLDFLNFLNSSQKYKLFVHDFTYPMGTISQAFNVSIPVKVLYK